VSSPLSALLATGEALLHFSVAAIILILAMEAIEDLIDSKRIVSHLFSDDFISAAP
jgi:hypothetical protein